MEGFISARDMGVLSERQQYLAEGSVILAEKVSCQTACLFPHPVAEAHCHFILLPWSL
jgi:hypothetical protein